MLRRAPTLAFCAVMSAALGAGFAEVVVAVSVPVSIAAGAHVWLNSRRQARSSAA